MNDNTLDNIFKKTFSSENIISEDDNNLDEFELKLYKKMFLKFSWLQFNVYYINMIMVCFFSSSLLVISYFFAPSANLENKSVQNPTFYTDSLSSDQKRSLPTTETLLSKKSKSTSSTPLKENNTLYDLSTSTPIKCAATSIVDAVAIITSIKISSINALSPSTPIILNEKRPFT